VAQNADQITDAATAAAASAGELDGSIRSVVRLAKQADEVSRQSARDAEEGGASVENPFKASIVPGIQW